MAYRSSIPLTAEWLVKTYLTGLNLTDDDGNYYPPEVFQMPIKASLDWAESVLGIRIRKTNCSARLDFSGGSLSNYHPITIPDAKIQSITTVKWKLGNSTPVITWPGDWFVVRDNQLQFVPASTGSGGANIESYPLYQLYMAQQGNSNLPGIWEVDYVAGFETQGTLTALSTTGIASGAGSWVPNYKNTNGDAQQVWGDLTITLSSAATVARTFTVYGWRLEDGKPFDGVGRLGVQYVPETVTIPIGSTTATTANAWSQVTKVLWTGWTATPTAHTVTFSGQLCDPIAIDMDWDLMDLIGKAASIHILNTAGDLIIGAGIANKSTSIDGISASIGTTSSPTNAGYGARIIQLQKDINRMLPVLFRKYNGVQVLGW